jgi:molecular chaperone GrpE
MFKSKKEKLDKELIKEEMKEMDDIKSEDNAESNIEEETNLPEEKTSVDADLQKQVNSLRDQLLRKAAEFENYKKRTENELSSFFKYASEALIIELLPVLDDFERLFNSYNEKHDAETFKKGVELIYEKLEGILKKQGLKQMETNGKQFDFNLHDAILQIPDYKNEPNTILETAEKGYFLKDKVIRHAKVLVSSRPEKTEGEKKNK